MRVFLALACMLPLVSAAADGMAQGGSPGPAVRVVKVGPYYKRAIATITSMQAGDRACYVTLRDDRGTVLEELAGFEICEEEAKLLNKRVELKWEMGNVLAASCQGNMDCGKSDRVALIVEAKPIR